MRESLPRKNRSKEQGSRIEERLKDRFEEQGTRIKVREENLLLVASSSNLAPFTSFLALSVVDPRLWFDPLLVGVFHFIYFADRVSSFDDLRMGISSGQYQMQQGGFLVNDF